MKNRVLSSVHLLLLLAVLCGAREAHATTSQIDTSVPVAGEAVDVEPIRQNFQYAHDEINDLYSRAASGLSPIVANAVLGSLAGGLPFGIIVPSCSGPANALTWATGVGFGCNTISSSGGGSLSPAAAYTVLAGPLGGAPAIPTSRGLTGNDLPLPSSNSIGGVESLAATAHQFLTGISTSGIPARAQPDFSDLTGTSNQKVRTVGIQIGGQGASITPGLKGFVIVPYSGTITGWRLVGDVSGSIVVDVWKVSQASVPASISNTIAGSDLPTLSSSIQASDSTLTGWGNASVSAGDVVYFYVNSASVVTQVNLVLTISAS